MIKKSLLCVFLSGAMIFFASAKNLATISYKSRSGPVTFSISVDEFRKTYKNARQLAPDTPPAPEFFQDYLRYRIGVERAYNDPSLVKNPNIKGMISNPLLRENFEQLLYKTLAEKNLKHKVAKINQEAQNLPRSTLLSFYKKNPEFAFKYIHISLPQNASKKQIREARARAKKVHREVSKVSKRKPFNDLVDLYSDDRVGGKIDLPRNRNKVLPPVYNQLLKMSSGQVSSPIQTDTGFYIIKLERKLPFNAANQTQIKVSYFDKKRGEALKDYFEGLKKQYTINVNRKLLKSI